MSTIAQTHSPGLKAGTLSALSSYNFRLYFAGQLISLSGSWMQTVAQGWLVFHLTKQELWLGVVALAAGVPNLLLSPFAGVVVDRVSRRNLLMFSQVAQMLLAFILSALSFTNTVQVWHIVVLAFFLGVVNAIDAPSRQAFVVDLVGHEKLTSGIQLNSIMFNTSRVIGPAIAGLVLTQVGPAWCFLLNGLSFVPVFFMLWIMDVHSVSRISGDFAPLRSLKEGVRFTARHETIAPLLVLAITASFFTANITTLLPAFSDRVLNSPKEGYAAMSTAIGLGAVLAALLMAVLGRRYGRGRVVTAAVGLVLVASVIMSQMTQIPLAVIMAASYGFGIILQFVTVNTLIQSEVPDQYRGRVLSLYMLTFFGIAPLGSLGMGFLAENIGTSTTIALSAIVGGIISLLILYRSAHVRRLA